MFLSRIGGEKSCMRNLKDILLNNPGDLENCNQWFKKNIKESCIYATVFISYSLYASLIVAVLKI